MLPQHPLFHPCVNRHPPPDTHTSMFRSPHFPPEESWHSCSLLYVWRLAHCRCSINICWVNISFHILHYPCDDMYALSIPFNISLHSAPETGYQVYFSPWNNSQSVPLGSSECRDGDVQGSREWPGGWPVLNCVCRNQWCGIEAVGWGGGGNTSWRNWLLSWVLKHKEEVDWGRKEVNGAHILLLAK